MRLSHHETKLDIWMYKFLLGTLSKEKTKELKKILKSRYEREETRTALEIKIYTAFLLEKSTREYLACLLDDWEKRTSG